MVRILHLYYCKQYFCHSSATKPKICISDLNLHFRSWWYRQFTPHKWVYQIWLINRIRGADLEISLGLGAPPRNYESLTAVVKWLYTSFVLPNSTKGWGRGRESRLSFQKGTQALADTNFGAPTGNCRGPKWVIAIFPFQNNFWSKLNKFLSETGKMCLILDKKFTYFCSS